MAHRDLHHIESEIRVDDTVAGVGQQCVLLAEPIDLSFRYS